MEPITRAHFAQALGPGVAGRNLRAKISFALIRGADVAQQQRQNVSLHRPGAHDPHRRNAESFLVDLTAQTHRSGISPTHIRVVGA